jgi:hypothetical protein
MDFTTGLPLLLHAKSSQLASRIQFSSWPAGALGAIASLFDMTEVWQAGLYAVAVGWCCPLMILGKRANHQLVEKSIGQIV